MRLVPLVVYVQRIVRLIREQGDEAEIIGKLLTTRRTLLQSPPSPSPTPSPLSPSPLTLHPGKLLTTRTLLQWYIGACFEGQARQMLLQANEISAAVRSAITS